MRIASFINVLTASVVSCTFGFNSNDGPGKVRLTDINVLTLNEGSYTTGRRSTPVPHLTCLSGSACGHSHLKPKTVQCRNQGSDGYDVQWKCEADLDSSVKFGRTDVTCEGYDYPEDPFVLRGSCGLEYVLEFVHGSSQSTFYSHNTASKNSDVPSAFSSFISMICCVGLVIFLLWMCSSNNRNPPGSGTTSNPDGNYWGGGGPGGGGGGGYDGGGGMGWRGSGPQPPPYNDPFNDSGPSCGFNNNGCGSASYPRRPRAANAGFGGPGFWSGLAAGGLMGYMFGGNRNRHGYNNTYHNQRYNNPFGNAGPSWGGAGSSGGFSGGTRSASGFGGTRRR